MDCKEAKQKIFEAIDGTLEDRSELDAHLEECASCRAEYRELSEVQDGLQELAQPALTPPEGPDMAAKVSDALGDEEPGDIDPLEDASDIDSSGLHDIRNLAALATAQDAGDSVGDLFGLGRIDEAGPSVEVPAVVPPPVLMPVETTPRWVKPALIAGGVLILTVAALAAVLFIRQGRQGHISKHDGATGPVARAGQDRQDTEPNADTDRKTTTGDEQAMGAPARPTEPNTDGHPTDDGNQANRGGQDTPTSPAADSHSSTSASSGRGMRRTGRSRHRGRRTSEVKVASKARSPAPRESGVPDFSTHARAAAPRSRGAASASSDPLAALLHKPRGGSGATNAPKENLPQNLTTSQIRRVMGRATGAMKRCYELNKQSGMLTVRVTVKGSTGRIASLSISGKFRGTPTARCAVKALRRLKFPRFAAPTQKFSYPYLLR